MSVDPPDPYQPFAPLSGGYRPLNGYVDDGLFVLDEPAGPPLPESDAPARPVVDSEPPQATTMERLRGAIALRGRRLSPRRGRDATTPS